MSARSSGASASNAARAAAPWPVGVAREDVERAVLRLPAEAPDEILLLRFDLLRRGELLERGVGRGVDQAEAEQLRGAALRLG